MRFSRAVLTTLLLLLVVVLSPAQERDVEEGAVAGVVASAGTLSPLNGALVTLRDVAQEHPPASVVSGPAGRFGFEGLPESRYELWVSKSGYDARTNSLRYIRIEADQQIDDLTIQIWRQASISGTVTDSFGDAVEDAALRAYALRHGPHGPSLVSVGTARSDDLGSYRIYGLSGGDYFVEIRFTDSDGSAGMLDYAGSPAFYPRVATPSEASRLSLRWGEQLDAIDFELDPPEATMIAGVVANGATGLACGSCPVSIVPSAGAFKALPYRLKADKDGGFAVRGLPAGRYLISASGGSRAGALAVEIVEVVDGIAAEVALTTGLGVEVRGTVVIDDTRTENEDDRGSLQVILTPTADTLAQTRRSALVSKETFQFTASGVAPGDYRITLQNLPAGSYLESATLSGRRLEQPLLRVGDSSPGEVEMRVSAHGANVVGVVETDDSRPGVVVLMPSTRPWHYRVALTKRYEEDRSFRFEGVAPGSYLVYAIPDREAYDIYDPAVREDLRKLAVSVTLERGASVTVELQRVPEPR